MPKSPARLAPRLRSEGRNSPAAGVRDVLEHREDGDRMLHGIRAGLLPGGRVVVHGLRKQDNRSSPEMPNPSAPCLSRSRTMFPDRARTMVSRGRAAVLVAAGGDPVRNRDRR